jgi:SPP1 family phage portal protein
MNHSEILGKAKELWNKGSFNGSSVLQRNHRYYWGHSVPQQLHQRRLDGKSKTPYGFGWIRVIADIHTGFATSKPIQYFAENKQTELDFIKNIFKKNKVASKDTFHFLNCILFGRSFETIWYDEDYRITDSTPFFWNVIYNEKNEIEYAIYKAQLAPQTVFRGRFLESATEVIYVYSKEAVSIISYQGEQAKIEETIPHSYGIVPVVEFNINKEKLPFISDDIIDLADSYNISRSNLQDDVKWNVDSLLMVKNFKNFQVFLQKIEDESEDQIRMIDLIKSQGVFPVPEGSDASYLSREIQTEKFKLDQEIFLQEIYVTSYMPNVLQMSRGDLSSSALKMMFFTLNLVTEKHMEYFTNGLSKRIEIINKLSEILGNPTLYDYDINWRESMPSSDTELFQYLGKDFFPKKDLYKSINFFDDPDKAYEQWQIERSQFLEETRKNSNELPN